MNNANSLSLEQVHDNVQLNSLFDGAMSAAPTRGQLPRHQRRHHHRHQRRRHHRRSHQRHHHYLRNNNNNHRLHPHHHHHHLPPYHGHNCHGQCQYTSHQPQRNPENYLKEQEKNEKRTHKMNENEEPAEKRPKVNPIFLWALQREQRIVEVRCEDYDKRNRIKLTKTPHGWRSIPRTSSNVYSLCCCAGSNFNPVTKDKSTSPSVSSTCISRSISSKSASSSPSSLSESTSFSSRSESCSVKTRKKNNDRVEETKYKKGNIIKRRPQTRNSRYHISEDDESDATRSSCRNSQQSFDLSYVDDQNEDPDNLSCENENRYDKYEFHGSENDVIEEHKTLNKTNLIEKSSKFLNVKNGTFRFIDLEMAKKNQLLQPRVVLEPLNSLTILSNTMRDRSKLDDEIEMVEEDEDETEQRTSTEEEKAVGKDTTLNIFHGEKELFQDQCTKIEENEDEIEEIEDKDDIDELIEDNATVFEYEDRDSVDMMDDNEFEEHDEFLHKPTELYPPLIDSANNITNEHTASLENDLIEEEEEEEENGDEEEEEEEEEEREDVEEEEEEEEREDVEEEEEEKEDDEDEEEEVEEEEIDESEGVLINYKQTNLDGTIPQVPDLKPINSDSTEKIVKNIEKNDTCIERLLPSPPCSVTCSEDASRLDNSQILPITPNRRRREAPDLIEVKPTEWRKRGELFRPAYQLRELIERAGHSIPDPLLVPRDRLPALAASPGIEIPRLLVTRPELRLPEALTRPELLSDPDILVISLAHLQQVLDAAPDPTKYCHEERINGYELSNGSTIPSTMNLEKKRLSVKPIGSLMPAPMDLSRHSVTIPTMENSILRMRNKFIKQESEVTSTARLPGDDSRLWHPLFGSRQKTVRQDDMSHTKLITHQNQNQDRHHHQRSTNYQQQPHQDSDRQHRASWHRTTLAS